MRSKGSLIDAEFLAKASRSGFRIAEIRLGLQYLDAVGLRTTYPYHLAGLAEALMLGDDSAGALDTVRRARAMSDDSLDRFYEAELLRLESAILHRMGEHAEADALLQRAMAVAGRQEATLFLSRAHAALSRARTGRPFQISGGDGLIGT